MTIDKKFENLKIRYDNTRTWLLSFIALGVSMSIGYFSVEDAAFKQTLAWTTNIVLVTIVILYIFQTIKYKKVLDYLGNKK